MALLGTEFEIDETDAGIERGVMTWKVERGEIEVLERFVQEVEWGYGVWYWGKNNKKSGGTDGGEVMVMCQWGWEPRQLAEWLCRIVVGEVVRDEEDRAGARTRARAEMKAKVKAKAKIQGKGR
jgi:hypothetical protein